MKYVKETPRVIVKFVDAVTEEVLFELNDKSWMDIGQLFSDGVVTSIFQNEYKNKKFAPKKILVIAVADFKLEQ